MKTRGSFKKLEPLLKGSSFTSEEARKLGVSSEIIAYYVKIGEIIRIGRGIYRGANSPTIDDFRWEDLAEAAARVKGGVICLISALALYDMTEEIPREHWIAIRNETSHRAGPAVRIVRMRNIDLGKTEIEVGGIHLPIFDRERTIVDAFRFLSLETAIKALRAGLNKKGSEKISFEKLRKYAHDLRVKIDPYVYAETTK